MSRFARESDPVFRLNSFGNCRLSNSANHILSFPIGDKAVFIIGKETVFYSYKTREILFRVKFDEIFIKIASSVGFSIEKIIDIELDKKNRNARPRSLDKYFESAIILRKF